MEEKQERITRWLVTMNKVLRMCDVVSIDQEGRSIYVTYVCDTNMNWDVLDIVYDTENMAKHIWKRLMTSLALGKRSVNLKVIPDDESAMKELEKNRRKEAQRLKAQQMEEPPEVPVEEKNQLDPELIEEIKLLIEKEKAREAQQAERPLEIPVEQKNPLDPELIEEIKLLIEKEMTRGNGNMFMCKHHDDTPEEDLTYNTKPNIMWIMTSDMMICLGNSDVIRLEGKTITISFKQSETAVKKGEQKKDLTITFPKIDEANKGWGLLNDAIVKNHRYLNLENGYTSIKDEEPDKKSWFGK